MSPTRNPDSSFTLDGNPLPSTSQPLSVPRVRTKAIRIPLTDDGKLDSSKLAPETVDKIRLAVGGTIAEPIIEKPPIKINREFIPTAYSLLEVGIQQAGKFFLKWPSDLASEMVFSPDKKEELIEPTAAVLEKYAPSWLVENQEIAALGAALTSAVNDMVSKGTERWALKHPEQVAEMLEKRGIVLDDVTPAVTQ